MHKNIAFQLLDQEMIYYILSNLFRYCGTSLNGSTVLVYGTTILNFYSNQLDAFQGFSMDYKITCPNLSKPDQIGTQNSRNISS